MDRFPTLDCVIVGAGPAGLTAATYLARFRRSFVVFDGGDSRAAWIPVARNCPGFIDGVSGAELLARLRAQAQKYGAEIVSKTVTALGKDPDGKFIVSAGDAAVRARAVLLATGVVDVKPNAPHLREALARGHVRICPVCDGYETIGKHVFVLGPPERAIKEALFLRAFAGRLTVLRAETDAPFSAEDRARMAAAGIEWDDAPLARLDGAGEELVGVLADGTRLVMDTLYPALGAKVRSDLAAALGAKCNDSACILADEHQQTSVEGLYAAGDVVNELNQIAVATGHAAIAATAIHNRLDAARR